MRPRHVSFGKPLAAVVSVGALVAAGALAPLALAEPSASDSPGLTASRSVQKAPDGKYIVRLAAAPVAMYDGNVRGLSATRSRDGASLDRGTSAVAEYRSYLDGQRASILDAVPGVTPFYEYDWAFAGFAAEMTYEQAVQVAAQPGVSMVSPNEMLHLETSHTPTFLGLDQPGGAWETAGGPDALGGAGEDVVIGSIDSGFTPESGSFAPLDPAPATTVPDGWLGTCDPGDPDDFGGGTYDGPVGDQPAELDCDGDVYNSKVIGAQYFVDGFGEPSPQEFLSARAYDGHGAHTASTAGGNYGVPVTVAGADLGEISGMAPRARISVYKVCWETGDAGGCASADTTAAIDQATADGVDVINYSISGSLDSATDTQAMAFMGAAASGIFVAASAGNSGTEASVAHNYPWVTTVAASTQDRALEVTVTLGNGDEYVGTGISTGVAETDAVNGADIPADGASPIDAMLCKLGALDPDKAEGKIVVCVRGMNARVEKSQAVLEAGGVGMVLTNDAANAGSTNTERHSVPTAHVSFADGQEIIDYVGSADSPTIALSPYELVIGDEVEAPSMASFSSRGPGGVADGNLLKPDITAPGVDIIASLAPYDPAFGELYGFESGTSMSSPHIAGIAALIRDIHPDWSPMAIKSALMTGAYQTNNQGEPIDRLGEVATPFEYGAGHVDPQAAAAAPLVYESDAQDWLQFLCGTETPTDPDCGAAGGPINASELNLASIAVSNLAGVREVTRTLTNPTDAAVTVASSVESPEGFTTSVTPAELTIEPGASASFVVRFQQTTASLDEWLFGALTWTTTDARTVRSPLAVKAASFNVTNQLVSDAATGEITDVTSSGIDAEVSIALTGLDEAQVDSAELSDPTGANFPSDDPPDPEDLPSHVLAAAVDVEDGADLAQFELFADDYAATTDLDLFVYSGEYPDLELVASSATGAVDEKVTVDKPAAGPYTVYVDLWGLDPSVESEVVYLNTWVLGDDGVGDFTVTPDSFEAELGSETSVTYSWAGLEGPALRASAASPDVRRYLGLARYRADGDEIARTTLRVDVGAEVPPTTPPPTTPPPTTTTPTVPPPTTSAPPTTPIPSTTLPGTGGGDAGMFAALGLGAILLGGAFVALAARRLREN